MVSRERTFDFNPKELGVRCCSHVEVVNHYRDMVDIG
jgi:hypothetical protein